MNNRKPKIIPNPYKYKEDPEGIYIEHKLIFGGTKIVRTTKREMLVDSILNVIMGIITIATIFIMISAFPFVIYMDKKENENNLEKELTIHEISV